VDRVRGWTRDEQALARNRSGEGANQRRTQPGSGGELSERRLAVACQSARKADEKAMPDWLQAIGRWGNGKGQASIFVPNWKVRAGILPDVGA
jgi:hypothetical protein